jgi:hypothetical protein
VISFALDELTSGGGKMSGQSKLARVSRRTVLIAAAGAAPLLALGAEILTRGV